MGRYRDIKTVAFGLDGYTSPTFVKVTSPFILSTSIPFISKGSWGDFREMD
jgi:hypothetical protein